MSNNTNSNPAMNKLLDSFSLKCIAMALMVLDHAGLLLFKDNMTMRLIGRLSFPIFAFLIVEGYFHTHNVYKYMARLGLFALISELPYDLMIVNAINNCSGIHRKFSLTSALTWSRQNIFVTLLLGLIAIYLIDTCNKKWQKQILFNIVAQVVVVIGIGLLSSYFNADYGMLGILYIIIFYLNRGHNIIIALCIAIITGYLDGFNSPQLMCVMAIPFLAMYNGKKGAGNKYIFYAFYPVHILVLLTINYFIN